MFSYISIIRIFVRSRYLLSYLRAEETCQELGPRSHLPSVHSFQEIIFMEDLGRRHGWFGADRGIYLGTVVNKAL